jgi:hypothetical protein
MKQRYREVKARPRTRLLAHVPPQGERPELPFPAHQGHSKAALALIHRSLQDIDATITGLEEVSRRRSAAFEGSAPSSDRDPVSYVPLGRRAV